MSYAEIFTWIAMGLTLVFIGYVVLVSALIHRRPQSGASFIVKHDTTLMVVLTSLFIGVAVTSGIALLLGVDRPMLIPVIGIFGSAVPFSVYNLYLLIKGSKKSP